MTLTVALGCLLMGVTADAEWWDGFARPENVLNAPVFGMAVYNDQLIVGGWVRVIGGVTVNRVAAWYNDSWSPLAGGIDDFDCPQPECRSFMTCAVQHDSLLIVGGHFPSVDHGIVSQGVAAWDGTRWHSLGGGLSGLSANARAVTLFGSGVAVGGRFTHAGGIPASNVALWNGASWEALGDGFDGAVLGLATYKGQLIALGVFTRSGNTATDGIAIWNGASWEPFAQELGSTCWAAVEYEGGLLVAFRGGISGGTASGVARWDGISWALFGQEFLDCVESFAVGDGQVFIAGVLAGAGGIGRWNGFAWEPVGDGVDGTAGPLAVFEHRLYVGGDFQSAGGQLSPFLARWDVPTPVAVSDLRAERVDGDVLVRWRVHTPEPLTHVRVLRGLTEAGPSFPISDALSPELDMSYRDEIALANQEYWYRIAGKEGNGEWTLLTPAVYVGPDFGQQEFELVVRPLLGRGSAQVDLTVPSHERYSVEVFDPRGRLIACLADGRGPIRRSLQWDPTATSMSSGVYFVVLTTRAHQTSRKAILVR